MIDPHRSDRQPPPPDPRDEYAYRFPGNPDRDEARALEEFNAALQQAVNEQFMQPF